MSFNVQLQRNFSPPNKVDKDVTNILLAQGVLKAETSIIDPAILIDTVSQSDMIAQVNYLWVETFGRYYYVTDIVSIRDQLWEVHCHVDVLMTYKSQIKQQNCIIRRQEQKYNMNLDDGWFSAFQDPIIRRLRFLSNGTPTNPFEHNEYVLVVAGADDVT